MRNCFVENAKLAVYRPQDSLLWIYPAVELRMHAWEFLPCTNLTAPDCLVLCVDVAKQIKSAVAAVARIRAMIAL